MLTGWMRSWKSTSRSGSDSSTAARTVAGQKRKAHDEPLQHDPDEIVVAMRPPKVRRAALADLEPQSAQNKRLMVLDHVFVPPHKPGSRTTSTISKRSSARTEAFHSVARTDQYAVHILPNAGTSPDLPSSGPRPRRNVQRPSYASHDLILESSGDELVRSSAPRRKTARPRAKAQDSSDYEDDASGAHSNNGVSNEPSSSDAPESSAPDETSEDDGPSAKRSAKRPPASSSTTSQHTKGPKPTAVNMKRLISAKYQLGTQLAPMHESEEIFADIVQKALEHQLGKILPYLHRRPLRVATMCSGTESPIIALDLVQNALERHDLELPFEHVFSAEIVPYKQAFIQRNFQPPILFRDITKMDEDANGRLTSTTAYGSKATVPVDIDLLVAGTSCVDYSNLNKRKKGIDDGGESGSTFDAVLKYCKATRPRIVLLENVLNAPWDMKLERFKHAGYVVAGVKVDSKDYYLPQTRQRGYMVCFDQSLVANTDIQDVCNRFYSAMENFRRPASSLVPSFLLPTDPSTMQGTGHVEDTRKNHDWLQCKIRHIEQRAVLDVGNSRPFSKWQDYGVACPPDHGAVNWLTNEVERVKDFTDIAFLRKLKFSKERLPMDIRYKCRFVDVSQNIDKEMDTQKPGMIGCITPSGMPLVTNLARPVTSVERLILQGIPLDKISLTTETPKEVADLAGNAMTTTVVGPAILSALMAISNTKILDKQHTPKEAGDRPCLPPLGQRPKVVRLTSDPRSADMSCEDMSIRALLDTAETSARRCYCEGDAGVAHKPIQTCQSCKHTTCTACGGNPEHDYAVGKVATKHRTNAGEFLHHLRTKLPLRIDPPRPKSLKSLARSNKDPESIAYTKLLQKATSESYGLQKPQRTSIWTVTYVSQSGESRMILVLDKRQPEWRLFVEPPKDLPSNDPLRSMLQQPVAVGKIEDMLFNVTWCWRGPSKIEQPASIEAEGRRVPSIWARNRMPGFDKHTQPQILQVKIKEQHDTTMLRNIEGMYELLPQCGTAFDSLYKRRPIQSGDPDLYLFCDPDPTGPSELDSFVFSTSQRRLEGSEVRLVDAWTAPSYAPWSVGPSTAVVKVSSYEWVHLDQERNLAPATTNALWGSQNLQSISKIGTESCDHFAELATFQVTSTFAVDKQLSDSSAWIAEAVRRELPIDVWTAYAAEDVSTCHTCAPPKPLPVWNLGADSSTVERFEDPAMAAQYEQSVKHRPQSAIVDISNSGGPTSPIVHVSFALNLTTLAHRARAQLPAGVQDVAYRWRLSSNVAGRGDASLRLFKLVDTSGEQPVKDNLRMTIDLFPQQLKSLAWMRRQEQGETCELEGLHDATVAELDLRVEMRAMTKTTVRGGILADHPAFGKTILCLAVIQSQYQAQTSSDTIAEIESRRPSSAHDLLITPATLIVCHSALVDQWQGEIEDKVKYKEGVIAIRNASDLAKFKIDDFKAARIVLVSKHVLTSDGYISRLAALAGLPGPVQLKGRAFKEWLAEATKRVPGHLHVLQRSGPEGLKRHVKKAYEAAMESDQFKHAIPSRRLKGKDYMAAKDNKSKADNTKTAAGSLDASSVGRPLFEMFLWNRIIVDEFHKYESQELAAITSIRGDKRWGLSATPRMGDAYDVAQMGSLLGVSLPIGAIRRGVMKAVNIKDMHKQMTPFEKFEAGLEAPSDAVQARAHELNQNFLYRFVRQTLKEFDSGNLVPIKLDFTHQTTYAELSTQLMSLEMKLSNAAKSGTAIELTHREQLHRNAVANASTAEEALSEAASYCSPETFGEERGLRALISRREKEVQDLLRDMSKLVPEAKRKESSYFAHWKAETVDKNGIGDVDVQALVKDICDSSRTNAKHATALQTKPSDDEGKSMKQGKRILMSKINGLLSRLLTSKRSLRYVSAVQSVRSMSIADSHRLCEDSTCQSRSGKDDIAASAECGHIICLESHKDMMTNGSSRCPAAGCLADLHAHNLLWRSKMANIGCTETQHGAKIAKAIEILRDIRRRGDKAILFVEFQGQVEAVRAALRDAKITAAAPSGPSASRDIESFKEDLNNETVMVLNSSEETADGLNLQMANHVIFLSPLLRDQQYAYNATMAQAVGRVDRPGQEKEIFVYRIFALDTIDVDVLEHRERRTEALIELGAPAVQIPDAVRRSKDEIGDEVKAERMQLVKDEGGRFSLRPQSWLLYDGQAPEAEGYGGLSGLKKKGSQRVPGWEDFSTLVSFSRTYVEDDE